MNTVCLVGRIGREPEMKYSQSGTQIVNFSVAVERYKSDEPDWFEVVAFEKTADFVAQYLDKGALVSIEGRLQQDRWETQGGEKRSTVKIIANSVQGLESKPEAERRRGKAGQQAQPQAQQARQAPAPQQQAAQGQMPTYAQTAAHNDDPFGD